MSTEHLLFEQAQPRPSLGAVWFVTVLKIDEVRGQRVRESHVFIGGEGRHLHEIVCAPVRPAVPAELALREAGLATHRLLAKHLVDLRANLRATQREPLQVWSRRLADHPFFHLRLAGLFQEELWQIQDWTTSARLRAMLAQVTRYRGEFCEAELLKRIFAPDGTPAQPAG